ncbi:MAG: hypothetical protein ABIE94_03075 [archaeon]
MSRKKIRVSKYVLVLILTLIIFSGGLAVGSYTTNRKFMQVDYLEQELRTQTMSIETQFLILSENPCGLINHTPFTDELYEVSEKLGYMEDLLGKKDQNVLRLKQYYSLLQIRHWLLMQKMNEECNEDNVLILYFYSNLGDCDKCTEQGFVLTNIREDRENVRIYPFDINLDNPALDTISSLYLGDNRSTPILIINEKVYHGFKDKEAVLEILDNPDVKKNSPEWVTII